MSCSGGINTVSHKSYGSFYDTTQQTASNTTTAYSMKLNTTDLSDGVTIVSSSRITFANAGIYDLQFSAQINKDSGNKTDINIWLAYTGSNVPNTNTKVTVNGSSAKLVAAWDFMFNILNPNDYVELKWSTNDVDASLFYQTTQSSPARPAIPSLIVTVMQI
jgi:hypothetical protein